MKLKLTLALCSALLAACAPQKEVAAAQGQELTDLPSSLTPDVVGKAIEDYAAEKGEQWCVPTPGLVQLDERVLYYVSNAQRPQAVMSPAFRDLLKYMEKAEMVTLQTVTNTSGEGWLVTFQPLFRARFGVTTGDAIRGAALKTICLTPLKVQNLLSSRTATYNGYRWTDVKVRYSGDATGMPAFVTEPAFREFVGWNIPGARRPEDVSFGDARLELQDGRWHVTSFE